MTLMGSFDNLYQYPGENKLFSVLKKIIESVTEV
ncbi:hypothetical protein H4683_003992 [Filibacter limicola]|uniref:Uncharacterized protein n=1 Tax=Sporosarcina limicola TaxID=34101 RepID=A0A927MMS5_9BACL|nr:hypothetical protein [Sporosarcina limicola]